MKKKLFAIVIVGAVLAFFYTSNPSEGDFMNYIDKQAKMAKDKSEDSLKKFLVGLDEKAENLAVKGETQRKDYYIFSIFEVSDKESNQVFRVVGFAKKIFIPLNPGQKDELPNIY
jgi:uncharacterized protein YxeA